MPLARSHKAFTLLVVVPFLVGLCTSADAGVRHVELKTRYEYYDIVGATAESLYDQMDTRGPEVEEREGDEPVGYWALLRWEPEISWACVCGRTKCKVIVDEFTIRTTLILPRWANPEDGSQRLRMAWRELVKTLKRRVITRRDITHRTGRKVLRDLRLLPPRSSCKKLSRAVDKLVKKRDYDGPMSASRDNFVAIPNCVLAGNCRL